MLYSIRQEDKVRVGSQLDIQIAPLMCKQEAIQLLVSATTSTQHEKEKTRRNCYYDKGRMLGQPLWAMIVCGPLMYQVHGIANSCI